MKLRVGVYMRKSTDQEDNQVLSLQKQKDSCDRVLAGLGDYEVVKVWEESITGLKAGVRPGFKEMQRMIEKGKIDVIVTWKLHRLARNILEQAHIETYLQENKIKMIICEDGTFRPTDNVLMMRIYFAMATEYSRSLGRDASQGMMTKVKGGQPVKVPRGYEFDKFKNAIPTIEAPAIREIFRLKKLGSSLLEIAQQIHVTHGFSNREKPVPTSTIHRILENPLYYGGIRYMGEVYEGSFQPIISYTDWKEANGIHGVQKEKNPGVDFARNLVYNKESDNPLCPFLSKGCLYFRSTEREGPKINVSFTKLIAYFDANIHKYEIPEAYRPYIIEGFREFCLSKHGDIEQTKKNIMQELSKIDRKKANLLDMRMNEELEPEEYKKLKNELSDRYFELSEQLGNFSVLGDDILEKGESCFKLLENLSQTWKEANLIQKSIIIKMICFRVYFDKEKALILEERELFREVRNLNDCVWLGSVEFPKTPLTALYASMVYHIKQGGMDLTYPVFGVPSRVSRK